MDEPTKSVLEPVPFTPRICRAPKTAHAPVIIEQNYDGLQTAYQSLEARITDLEQDWDVRDQEFWQETLHTLQSVRKALSLVIASLRERNALSPSVNTAYLADEHLDEVAILITAHCSAQRPRREPHIRQRHEILFQLRKLTRYLQDILLPTHREEGR
jgi:hypothetical protein